MPGAGIVSVLAAGLNPSDRMYADGVIGSLPLPRVVGNEGVGLISGRRVYFERTLPPHGALAPRALTQLDTMIDVRDDIDDVTAVTLGISSLAAWVSLEHTARVEVGERVLVLGASGPVGQAAVYAARLLGAGRVVAAARHQPSLKRLLDLGVADAVVVLDGVDDASALRASTDRGFDVVVDPLFGEPLVAALHASAERARVLELGMSAGDVAAIPWLALRGRTLFGYSNLDAAPETKRLAYVRMMKHAAAGSCVSSLKPRHSPISKAYGDASGRHRIASSSCCRPEAGGIIGRQ
jgi:NADPH:quinone reductase-like Zn-dependent oxidoreductase